jgi:hypothetical protein
MNLFSDALLPKIKDALRITHTDMDVELTDIINACKQDMELAGVVNITEDEPLVIRAVILYAKAHFSFSDDGNKFQQSYDGVKNLLRLSGEGRA